MTSIEISTPDGAQQFTLQTDSVTIGRLTTNDIVLPYSHISRRHAELRKRKDVWWVTDMRSTNGLHVSGQRVQETPLDPGMVIELSPHVSLRLLPTPILPEPAKASLPEEPQITPLAAYAPRSPFAEDETPFYPQMRPAPPESRPHVTRPSALRPEAKPISSLHPASSANHSPDAAMRRLAPDIHAPQIQTDELMRRSHAPAGASSTLLHICQTCGQLTAPEAVYCQSCHHSIASECQHCRLSLLPVQDTCPRCQTPNPASVRRNRRAAR